MVKKVLYKYDTNSDVSTIIILMSVNISMTLHVFFFSDRVWLSIYIQAGRHV